jgi:predicted transcriptional regulator
MSKSGRQQGELEALVLDTLWNARERSSGPLTSQQIMDELGEETDIAMTTLLTVLSRLVDKDLVIREPGAGRSLLFEATKSREVHNADLMLKLMADAGNPALAMSHFAAGLSPAALEALRNSLK